MFLPPLWGKVGMGGMDRIKARELRKNMTEAERILWRSLRLRQIRGYKFRRQQPIGKYIVDFVCLEKRLIIEVDGGQHSEQIAYDSERDAWLKSQGFGILRFWDNQVLKETEAVNEIIVEVLSCKGYPPTYILPRKGGGGTKIRPAKIGENFVVSNNK
jgi:very-short-patch-repair endonuclease